VIAEIGHAALVLALALAVAQAVLPLIGAQRRDGQMMAVAIPAALAQLVFVALSFAALTWCFVVSDFSVELVARNSHSLKPMLYKVSGVWGNHEGSMLLWVLILALFGALVALFGANLPETLRARVLAVQAMIAIAFLAFILFTSNPFARLDPAPVDGRDLNPLLQDPGLAFHPPFLYLGYVGLSTTFSFAIAALIEGRVDAAWARWVRPWTLAAWASLTLGIAMGSWWAYYELGWGGWWFWDPVENASFMPWLIATALLHSAIVAEKREALKTWTVLLAILAFSLSLIGTFLVRSGVLTSVHAFAVDPERGLFILLILVVAIGGSLALYAWRAPGLAQGGLFQPVSREGALVVNNLLLATATLTVFLGTLYPLFLDALGGGKVSVGPPFFNATFVPLMLPLLAMVAIGPLLAWKRGDARDALRKLAPGFVVGALAALATWLTMGGPVLAIVGMALAAWLVAGAAIDLAGRCGVARLGAREAWARARGLPRSAWGTAVAHAGLGVMVAGITASSAWQAERIMLVRAGDRVELAGYTLVFHGVARERGPNYTASRARFEVTRDGRPVATLSPAKRFYPMQQMTTTEAAIHTTGFGDLYVAIGDPAEAGAPGDNRPAFLAAARADAPWAARVYHNPLAPWIWIGPVIMVVGGVLSLSDRRLRVGAPRRRALAVAPAE
jgi:cytochrome c-type biogenesis protein CcmF